MVEYVRVAAAANIIYATTIIRIFHIYATVRLSLCYKSQQLNRCVALSEGMETGLCGAKI